MQLPIRPLFQPACPSNFPVDLDRVIFIKAFVIAGEIMTHLVSTSAKHAHTLQSSTPYEYLIEQEPSMPRNTREGPLRNRTTSRHNGLIPMVRIDSSPHFESRVTVCSRYLVSLSLLSLLQKTSVVERCKRTGTTRDTARRDR